mgnify:CR=1 FL=1
MKRFFTLTLAVAFFLNGVEAKERTMDEKQAIAASVLNNVQLQTRGVTAQPLHLLQSSDTYTVLGDDSRFVVLSNDDAFDAVIGYADSPFDAATNSSLAWYLQAASEAMKTNVQKGSAVTRALVIPKGDFKEAVAPLCKTFWAQDKPYNNLCPTTSKGKAYPSGCVATALSQIMYYHKYPVKGKGSHQYSFTPAVGDGRLLSCDFENTTFDWDNMLLDYGSQKDYTDVQANAVAQLMAAVGVSVDMQYTESGSGAMSREARYGLINYFCYNENINWLNRSFYSAEEWMKYIYTELNNERPIYYTGDDEKNGGHAFVLDGYDAEGMVHINWGWGPKGGNGYFDIALLNPSGFQFSEGQDMLIGISPKACLQYESRLYSEKELKVSKVATLLSVQPGKIYNQTGDDFTGDIAVVMESADGTKYPVQTTHINKAITYYYVNDASSGVTIGGVFKLPTTLADGEYRTYVASKCDKESDWRLIRTPEGTANSYMVTIKDGKLASVGEGIADDTWTTGISSVISAPAKSKSAKVYNINGQQVDKSYHGIVIKNGKKVVQ